MIHLPRLVSVRSFARAASLAAGAALIAAAASAQTVDSAAFIIRLGSDTVAVERYRVTAERIVAEAVSRSPSTVVHRFEVQRGPGGEVRSAELTARRPGTEQPASRVTWTYEGDSVRIMAGERGRSVAAPGGVPMGGPFYFPYELAIRRAVASQSRQLTVPLLTAFGSADIAIERVGTDSMALNDQFDQPMRVHIGPEGRLLHLHTPGGTTVERLGWVDLEGLARDFADRDERGRGLGVLSPRATFRAEVEGASIWVDYGRPAARGRSVMGGLVPYDVIWRTGANQATHFSTDRTLAFEGGGVVPPGTYTLFTIPGSDGWMLIFSRQTGQAGLDYDQEQDLLRIPMAVERLERPVERFTIAVRELPGGGGALALEWEHTRAVAGFRVQQ